MLVKCIVNNYKLASLKNLNSNFNGVNMFKTIKVEKHFNKNCVFIEINEDFITSFYNFCKFNKLKVEVI